MVKTIDRAVEKAVVAGHVTEEIDGIAVIGEITSSLSCDVDFLSGLFILFNDRHSVPVFGGRAGSHETGSTGADDNYFSGHTGNDDLRSQNHMPF